MCHGRDKVEGKSEVMFGEAVGRVSSEAGGRPSSWFLLCVVE